PRLGKITQITLRLFRHPGEVECHDRPLTPDTEARSKTIPQTNPRFPFENAPFLRTAPKKIGRPLWDRPKNRLPKFRLNQRRRRRRAASPMAERVKEAGSGMAATIASKF